MKIITSDLLNKLKAMGITFLKSECFSLPDKCDFEPPCALKWMDIHHSFKIGAFSYGVSGFYFNCEIGRFCSFGENVQIGRHPHSMHWFSTSPFFYQNSSLILDNDLVEHAFSPREDFVRKSPPVVAKRTVIGHDVWIGHGAFVLPGIKIGTGAVIAAMAVVTKDVPPYAIVAGSPAVVKKFRFSPTDIEKLLDSKWWEFAPWELKSLPVDNLPEFFRFIDQLRKSGVKPYQPDLITLEQVVGG